MGKKVTVKKYSHPRYRYVVYYPDGEKRKTKYFKNKTGKSGADEWALAKEQELAAQGAKQSAISDAERRAIYAFREFILNNDRVKEVSLQDAVDTFIEASTKRHKSIPCSDVLDSLLLRLQTEKKSKRHYDTTKSRIGRFCREYGDWLASDISPEIVSEFLIDLNCSPTTAGNYRTSLHGLFSHAIRLKAVEENPVDDAINIKKDDTEVAIYTPEDIARILEFAPERSLAGIAIACFAGLRRSEVERLHWKDINLEEGLIIVKAKKTSSRRIVDISDNLKAWLTPLFKRGEKVTGTTCNYRRDNEITRDSSGVTPKQNGFRHSFASYYLALSEDAPKTALQIGHKDTQVLFEHYRALVTKKDAKSYFSIYPELDHNIVAIVK